MLDAVVAFLWASDMGSQTFVGDELPQAEAASFIDLIYQTDDGYISVAVQTDREWTALTRALDRPDWLEDPRFATPALRHKHINTRLQMTQDVLMTRTAADWLDRLTAAGVPCAPVLTRTDMIRHPQVVENGIVVTAEHTDSRHAAPGTAGRAVLRHPGGHPPRRAGTGAAYGRSAAGTGLCAGGDRAPDARGAAGRNGIICRHAGQPVRSRRVTAAPRSSLKTSPTTASPRSPGRRIARSPRNSGCAIAAPRWSST